MVPADPTMDITQQLLPLFDGDAALQDPGVALLVELDLNNDKGLDATREPPSPRFVHRQRLTEEVVEVRRPPVGQGSGSVVGSLPSSMTSGSDGADGWLAPGPRASGPSPVCFSSSYQTKGLY